MKIESSTLKAFEIYQCISIRKLSPTCNIFHRFKQLDWFIKPIMLGLDADAQDRHNAAQAREKQKQTKN